MTCPDLRCPENPARPRRPAPPRGPLTPPTDPATDREGTAPARSCTPTDRPAPTWSHPPTRPAARCPARSPVPLPAATVGPPHRSRPPSSNRRTAPGPCCRTAALPTAAGVRPPHCPLPPASDGRTANCRHGRRRGRGCECLNWRAQTVRAALCGAAAVSVWGKSEAPWYHVNARGAARVITGHHNPTRPGPGWVRPPSAGTRGRSSCTACGRLGWPPAELRDDLNSWTRRAAGRLKPAAGAGVVPGSNG